MKPSGPLRRTGRLRRTGPLQRSAALTLTVTRKKRAAGRAPMPKALADMVLVRAGWRCDWCGCSILGRPFSRQHRRAHGMGGRQGAELHTPANVIVLCGSATSPGGCHDRAENQDREEAYRLRFAIRGEVMRPEETPIFRHLREWVIPGDGVWLPSEGPEQDV